MQAIKCYYCENPAIVLDSQHPNQTLYNRCRRCVTFGEDYLKKMEKDHNKVEIKHGNYKDKPFSFKSLYNKRFS